MSGPEAPDPYQTAAAGQAMNQKTAEAQQKLNMVNQITPWGNLTYSADPNSPGGYTATQSLSPENQKLYDEYTKLAGSYGTTGNALMGNVSNTLSQPFDFKADQARELSDMQRTFLDPQWERQGASLETDLQNRGIMPGTEAYRRAMEENSTNKQRAYDQNYLSSYQTAANMALAERNQPMSELNALMRGTQPQSMQFAQTPQTNVQGVDLAGMVQNNYNQESAQHNAMMGGLFGTGAAAMGGWGKAGFPMPSERWLKTDIVRIGDDPRGWGVYGYRYIGDDQARIGFMVDEVEPIMPAAVVRHPDGYRMIDYGMLL